MASERLETATTPHAPVLGIPGARGAAMVLRLYPASLPGLHQWETFLAPPEKTSAIGQVGAGCWFQEEEGGRSLEERRGREEGGGKREEGSPADLTNGKPPSLPKV